ncbi:MAG: zinc-dependent alcohol dehydrogenase family protein [Sedimenticolaceae bacterium]|nr:zinc-dependent alcohol dehydrogenase family protein [Sedimenticolaceae bacterium]
MRAVVVTAKGDPSMLDARTIDSPEISRDNHVLVKIAAAGVNPIDTKVRAGNLFGAEFPFIPGCDACGTVVETGTAVKSFKPGDKVWYCHGGLGLAQGNYAEYNVLEEWQLGHKPASIDEVQAAASPLVLITAWESLLTQARLQAGETVLIHAGAGGVGHVAIQLAKWRGARVITTVSSAEKAAIARELGADETIDYRNENLAERIAELTDGEGADVVYDTVGPAVFQDSIPLTAHYGRLVTLINPAGIDWTEARIRNLAVHFTLMLAPWVRNLRDHWLRQVDILKQCGELFDSGRLQVRVQETLPLEQAAEAHRIIEQGHASGKLVLTI